MVCLLIPCKGQAQASINETLRSILNRASVRSYQDRVVSADTLELLLKAGMAAPSCVNRQPWELLVLTDEESKEKAVRGLGGNGFVSTAPVVIIPCVNLQRVFNGDTYNWMAYAVSSACPSISSP